MELLIRVQLPVATQFMQSLANIWNDENLIEVLKGDGVAVMPTDTLYGIVGKAQSPEVVNRIYAIRKRNTDKPCIILIGDIKELEKFGIKLADKQKEIIKKYWPGPVSIIFDCSDDSLSYLHRGTKTLAFRLPALEDLRDLLIQTEPLIAPSANPEGEMPAKSIEEAKNYFGDLVNLYVDGGVLEGKPSKIIRLHRNGKIEIVRY